MKILILLISFLFVSTLAADPTKFIKEGKLIFEDDFNRAESDDSKEELGKNWVTNSKSRAKGTKQADLKENALEITMAKVADHAVSVRHDAPFDDGIVQARFKIHDKKGMKFNFNDPKAKKVTWAGHIAGVIVTPKTITIQDHKKGIFDLKIREKRKDKNTSAQEKKEIKKFLSGKEAKFNHTTELNKWYEITMVFKGPAVSVYVDGNKVGSFSSEGLDHSVKQNLAFSVPSTSTVDDVKIWSLD